MKKVQNIAAFLFIICVVFLTIVSILGVWKIFGEDVIIKSIKTIGLLAGVAALIIVAGRFIDSRPQNIIDNSGAPVPLPIDDVDPTFKSIRHAMVAVLIISSVVLALFGVLAIWDVVSGDILSKSLASLAIVAFASLVVVFTCLEREHHKLMQSKISGSMIFFVIIIGWMLINFLSRAFW